MHKRDGHILIAGGVVGVVSVAFVAAFAANAWTQIKQTGLYVVPDSFIEILNVVFGASVTVLGLGGLAAYRGNKEHKAIEHDKEKKCGDDTNKS